MNNIIGLGVSFGYIFLVIIVSTILNKSKLIKDEGSRKFIHIAVGNWWVIAMIFYDSTLYATIVPLVFIVLNTISYKFNIVKAMERRDDKNLGTIYYPVSLLVLVILSFEVFNKPYIGLIGILIMAYGDGFAAIVGQKFKSIKIYQNKTLYGTLTMFIVSIIVTSSILLIYNTSYLILSVLVVSIVATLLELYSKKGIDNITVPILSSLVYYLILIVGG